MKTPQIGALPGMTPLGVRPTGDARAYLVSRGWYQSFGTVIGEYWQHPRIDYILKGNAAQACAVLNNIEREAR